MIFLIRVFLYPLLVLIELPARFLNWVSIRIGRIESKYEILGEIKPSKNVAVFAVYPETTTWESFHRAALTLVELDYQLICVVNSNKYADAWLLRMQNSGFTTIKRPNVGADFGAYKLGIKIIKQKNIFKNIDNLLLINDSIYFTPKSVESLKKIGGVDSEYNCLYLHRQSIPHAGSMMIRFDRSVLNKRDFSIFWKKYFSYSDKKKTIRKGEHKLSKISGIDYFQPYISLKNPKLKSDLVLKNPDIFQVLTWAERSAGAAASYLDKAYKSGDHIRIIEYVLFNLQASNSLGLFFSREIGAPLKMDLVSSGLINPSDFIQTLIEGGCSSSEISSAERLIILRGSYFSRTTFERIRQG